MYSRKQRLLLALKSAIALRTLPEAEDGVAAAAAHIARIRVLRDAARALQACEGGEGAMAQPVAEVLRVQLREALGGTSDAAAANEEVLAGGRGWAKAAHEAAGALLRS